MKRSIKSSADVYSSAYKNARGRKILAQMKSLLDMIEATDRKTINELDLAPLTDELYDAVYDLTHYLEMNDPL